MDFYYLIESSPCRSILMLAKALGIELNRKILHLSKGEHLTPEFLKLNPQHTIPTLVDNDFSVWESRAILIYLIEKYAKDDALFPKCPEKRAVINQRLYFDMSLYSFFAVYYYPQVKDKQPADPEALKKVEEQLGFLNTFLDGQTYAAGDSLTVADFALLATISTFDAAGIEVNKFPNLAKWYEHCKKVVPGFDENWEGSVLFKTYFERNQ